MFTNVQVPVVVLGQDYLLLVIGELEVRDIILLDLGHLLASVYLLLTLLLLLLELLRCLLWPPGQVLRTDLPAQNAGLRPVSTLDTELDLGEDELRLFSPLHGAERLDLQLAEDVGRSLEVALLLLDIGQDFGDSRSLDLDKDLALRHRPECLDNRKLRLQVRRVVEEAHGRLHHLGDGLLELAMLLGQDQHLVVEEAPVFGVLAEGDDGDQYSRRRCEI